MERKVWHYWVEIRGKMKGKRKVTAQSASLGYYAFNNEPVDLEYAFELAELIAIHKPQKGTVWHMMRTVVSECVYDDGTVMHFVDLFDVNRQIIAQGDVK